MSIHANTDPPGRGSRAGEITRRVAKLFGPVALPLAGRRLVPIWALVHHTGRVSGRSLTVPVAIQRTHDGFLVPLPFARAQWPLNVLAAGGATVHWKGRDWSTTNAAMVGPEAASEFNAVERRALRLFGMTRFLRLRAAEPTMPT